jgi:hypothetical protein
VRIILHGQSQRRFAHEAIDGAASGSVVRISPPGRTLDQNALMWCLLADVARCEPQGREHTPDVWKSVFLHACGHEVQFAPGLSGLPFPLGLRSSRLSKAQMSELIEFIYAWGSENGVVWSDDVSQAAEA